MVYAVPALDIPLRLNLHAVQLSDEQFYRLCVNNPELQLERDRQGRLIISGVRLAWLLNPQDQTVEIYRPGQDPEVRSLPTVLSGEGMMVGFELTIDRFPL